MKITTINITATGTKTLTATFNQPVDSTKAVFAVKKGLTTVGVASATWNADKTVAQLALNSKITEGTYTVTVTGLSNAVTGSVVTENEKVAKINFLSTNLVTTVAAGTSSQGAGTVGYQVLNQYGEDITSSTALAGSLAYSTSAVSAGYYGVAEPPNLLK